MPWGVRLVCFWVPGLLLFGISGKNKLSRSPQQQAMLLVLAPPRSPKAEPGAGGTLPIEGQVILEAREKQRPSKAK